MGSVEITTTGDAAKILSRPGQAKGLPTDVQNSLIDALSRPDVKMETKFPGYYGADLPDGNRAMFMLDEKNNPILIYVGNHDGYDALSNQIRRNPAGIRKEFLQEPRQTITLSSPKVSSDIKVGGFNQSFKKAFGISGPEEPRVPGKTQPPQTQVDRDVENMVVNNRSKTTIHFTDESGGTVFWDRHSDFLVKVDKEGKVTKEAMGDVVKAETEFNKRYFAAAEAAEVAGKDVRIVEGGLEAIGASKINYVAEEERAIAGAGRSVMGRTVPLVGPIVIGMVVLASTGSAQAAVKSTAEGYVPGSTDGFKDVRNKKAKPADRILDGLNTVTAAGTLAVAVPGGQGVAAVSGISNLGVQVMRDVAYFTGLGDKPGIVGSMAQFDKNVVQPNARAESAMYRALLPMNGVAHYLFHAPEIHGNVSPELGQAIYRFNNISAQSGLQRVEEGAEFAKQLAKALREKGPEGDAVRKAMAPSLQKAGVSAAEYAAVLESYAKNLDEIDKQLKAHPDQYIQILQRSADLLNPPAPDGQGNQRTAQSGGISTPVNPKQDFQSAGAQAPVKTPPPQSTTVPAQKNNPSP